MTMMVCRTRFAREKGSEQGDPFMPVSTRLSHKSMPHCVRARCRVAEIFARPLFHHQWLLGVLSRLFVAGPCPCTRGVHTASRGGRTSHSEHSVLRKPNTLPQCWQQMAWSGPNSRTLTSAPRSPSIQRWEWSVHMPPLSTDHQALRASQRGPCASRHSTFHSPRVPHVAPRPTAFALPRG